MAAGLQLQTLPVDDVADRNQDGTDLAVGIVHVGEIAPETVETVRGAAVETDLEDIVRTVDYSEA